MREKTFVRERGEGNDEFSYKFTSQSKNASRQNTGARNLQKHISKYHIIHSKPKNCSLQRDIEQKALRKHSFWQLHVFEPRISNTTSQTTETR